jgi:hypothetical protein
MSGLPHFLISIATLGLSKNVDSTACKFTIAVASPAM